MKTSFSVPVVLLSLFLISVIYSLNLMIPSFRKQANGLSNYELSIAEGRLVWQKYNCQACHQLFGLGGYLGPDLTNITAIKGKDENYLAGVIKGGNGKMPAFKLSDSELHYLFQFLNKLNETGQASPASFQAEIWGTIRSKEN